MTPRSVPVYCYTPTDAQFGAVRTMWGLSCKSARPSGHSRIGIVVRASFDCAKVATPVERPICANPGLAGWDRTVAAAYGAALIASGGDTTITDDQKRWLAKRATCDTSRMCLYELMSPKAASLTK